MAVSLAEIWLPILLSAVFVFVASSVIWMALPIHKNDYKKFGRDQEEAIFGAVRGAPAGMYMFPSCDWKEMKTNQEMQARYERGPWGLVTIAPGKWNMGKTLSQWFLYLVVLSFFVGYVGAATLRPGTDFASVMQVTAVTAGMAYVIACLPMSIWESKPWSYTAKHIIDGVIYALITGATFAWLWPSGPGAALPGIGG